MQRRLLIAGGTLLIVLIVAVSAFFIIRALQKQAPQSEFTPTPSTGDLPAADETIPEDPLPTFLTPFRPSDKIAVTVSYTQGPQFSLTIDRVQRTQGPSTIEHFSPRPEDVYSILEVRDQVGNILSTDRFTFPTQLIAEGLDTVTGPIALSSNTETLVIPLVPGSQPASVHLLTPRGAVIAEQSFTYSELPSVDFESQSWWHRFWPIRTAAAQSSSSLVIVVTSTAGAESTIPILVAQTKRMVATLEPWKTYAGRIQVIPLPNSQDLNCSTVSVGSHTLPQCSNSAVISAVEPQVGEWHAIIVGTRVNCSCGFVTSLGGGIAAVGASSVSELIGHELGHAVGGLADEYLYQFNLFGSRGPNCFDSQRECEQANEPFKGDSAAQCSLGCNTASTWRPSTKLMHTIPSTSYGPFEECEMRKVIAGIVGEGSPECSSDVASPDEAPPATPPPAPPKGTYWGGGR